MSTARAAKLSWGQCIRAHVPVSSPTCPMPAAFSRAPQTYAKLTTMLSELEEFHMQLNSEGRCSTCLMLRGTKLPSKQNDTRNAFEASGRNAIACRTEEVE
eukprot:1813475-Amphidinium_carterae.1